MSHVCLKTKFRANNPTNVNFHTPVDVLLAFKEFPYFLTSKSCIKITFQKCTLSKNVYICFTGKESWFWKWNFSINWRWITLPLSFQQLDLDFSIDLCCVMIRYSEVCLSLLMWTAWEKCLCHIHFVSPHLTETKYFINRFLLNW